MIVIIFFTIRKSILVIFTDLLPRKKKSKYWINTQLVGNYHFQFVSLGTLPKILCIMTVFWGPTTLIERLKTLL